MPRTRKTNQSKTTTRRPKPAADAPTPAAPPTLRWQMVSNAIEAAIRSGEYAEGSRLPAETLLADKLDVNRHTVRRAVAELQRRGLLRPSPTGGSLVAPLRLSLALDSDERFAEVMENAGLITIGRPLASREAERPIPAEVARELNRPVRASMIVLDHMHLANDLPFSLITTWADSDRFARLADVYAVTGRLSAAFSQLGVRGYRRHKATISCRHAELHEAHQLNLEPDALLLVLKLVYVDDSGEPVSYSISRFPADRIEFVSYL